MSQDFKSTVTPSEQSHFAYSDEDRFIIRLLEQMLKASNHNPTVAKALLCAKHYLGDELNGTSVVSHISFSVSLELEPRNEGWFEAYRFDLYDFSDGFEIRIDYQSRRRDIAWANSTGAMYYCAWILKAGSHAFIPEDAIDEMPAAISEEEYKEGRVRIEKNVIRLLNNGAVIIEW